MELKRNQASQKVLVPDVEGGMLVASAPRGLGMNAAREVVVTGSPHYQSSELEETVEYYARPVGGHPGEFVVREGVSITFNYDSGASHILRGPVGLWELHPPAAK